MLIAIYSLLLAGSLLVSAPWWLYRMLVNDRYRAGLAQRLGRVPPGLRTAVAGRQVVWLHAVSVGELLAAQQLIQQLEQQLGSGWRVVISTTTATAQRLARERFSSAHVFYYPLDFAFAVRPWLRALQPRLVVLMESELWPRFLHECAAACISVAVANARVSDRSFRRTFPFRSIWLRMAAHVKLYLAQSAETAVRLEALGISPTRISTPQNLKYDLKGLDESNVSIAIASAVGGRRVVVGGSTLPSWKAAPVGEEELLIQAWEGSLRGQGVVLILAPRHPDRFEEVAATASEFSMVRASQLRAGTAISRPEIILLDTLGDLASVYSLASVALIGGSLVPRGGHNPLEAARVGVPILMGPSYENFREIVDAMRAADAIRMTTPEALAGDLAALLAANDGMGERARIFYDSQAGATARTIAALLPLISNVDGGTA